MDLEKFLRGGISSLQEDLYDPRHDECVMDFFSKSLDYKRKYAYGYGGYLERGYEHSGDPTLPDMQESYTMTTGRNEPLPPEFDFLNKSLFKRLCKLGEELIQRIVKHENLQLSGLSVKDFQFSMLVNYFYPYTPKEVETNRIFRMGEHIDESLFTAMPHGAVYDFEAFEDGKWGATPKMAEKNPIFFPGKLTQFLSGGAIPALKHRVRLSEKKTARISYPFMALPKSRAKLMPLGRKQETITGEAFMKQYLAGHINKDMNY